MYTNNRICEVSFLTHIQTYFHVLTTLVPRLIFRDCLSASSLSLNDA
jgi:hypothetical protein